MVHADTRRLRFTGRLPWRCRRHGAERRGLKDPEAEQLHELAVAPSDRRAPCSTTRAGAGERSPSQSQSRKSQESLFASAGGPHHGRRSGEGSPYTPQAQLIDK